MRFPSQHHSHGRAPCLRLLASSSTGEFLVAAGGFSCFGEKTSPIVRFAGSHLTAVGTRRLTARALLAAGAIFMACEIVSDLRSFPRHAVADVMLSSSIAPRQREDHTMGTTEGKADEKTNMEEAPESQLALLPGVSTNAAASLACCSHWMHQTSCSDFL